MQKYSAEALGKQAFKYGPAELKRFKDHWEKNIEAAANSRKKQLEIEIQLKLQDEKRILAEIAENGNPAEETVRGYLRSGILISLILIFPLIGEWVFAKWTIENFGLGYTETNIIAGAIMVLSLEGFDHYLTAVRQSQRSSNTIFITLGCIGIFLIFFLLLLSAAIREELYRLTLSLKIDPSLENTVSKGEDFTRQSSGYFVWLMMSLAAAFMVIGGVSYHFAKNSILGSLTPLRQYRKLNRVRQELQSAAQELGAHKGLLKLIRQY